jgi:hypothetical protein
VGNPGQSTPSPPPFAGGTACGAARHEARWVI